MGKADRKGTILVTGGAGYIGSHTVLALKRAGYEVLILDNLVYGHRDLVEQVLRVPLIVGDIADRELLGRIFREHDVSAVVHFAAFAYVGESATDPGKYYANNVAGTINLLESMRAAGVSRIVFSSTCAIYGLAEQLPIPENHPHQPINPYGAGKLMVEKILQDYDDAYGLRSVRLRYFNAAGADPDGLLGEDHTPETHLIPLVLLTALGRQEYVPIFGWDHPTPDGTCIRDYIHVSDLADAHVLGLDYLEAGGDTAAFNLGNGSGFSVNEVVETARRVTGRDIDARPAPRRPGDPPALVGSAEHARTTLGWRPKYPGLDDIVAHAWAWHQKRHG